MKKEESGQSEQQAAKVQEANENEELIEPETSHDEAKTQDDKPCDDAYGLENQNTSTIEKRARELGRKRSS